MTTSNVNLNLTCVYSQLMCVCVYLLLLGTTCTLVTIEMMLLEKETGTLLNSDWDEWTDWGTLGFVDILITEWAKYAYNDVSFIQAFSLWKSSCAVPGNQALGFPTLLFHLFHRLTWHSFKGNSTYTGNTDFESLILSFVS